jgi:hypothetical protein
VASFLIRVAGPLAVAAYFAVAYRRGGGRRLWRDATFVMAAFVGFALWRPNVEFYNYGPLNAAGVDSWSFPPGALITAAVIHALALLRLPLVFAVVAASLCASLILLMFTWVS